MRRTLVLAATVAALSLGVAAAPAAAAPLQAVKRNLLKVGVDKVLGVRLAPEQPAGDTHRVVVIKLAATFPKCAQGETFAFPEGKWEKLEYISYWAPNSNPCPPGGPVDLEHAITLKVGKSHGFVFVGPKKFNQRVSFRLEKGRVASTLIKKVIAK